MTQSQRFNQEPNSYYTQHPDIRKITRVVRVAQPHRRNMPVTNKAYRERGCYGRKALHDFGHRSGERSSEVNTYNAGAHIHSYFFEGDCPLTLREGIIVGHRGRRFHCTHRKVINRDTGLIAQAARRSKGILKTILKDHPACRDTVGMGNDPAEIVQQRYAFTAGTVGHRKPGRDAGLGELGIPRKLRYLKKSGRWRQFRRRLRGRGRLRRLRVILRMAVGGLDGSDRLGRITRDRKSIKETAKLGFYPLTPIAEQVADYGVTEMKS